MFERSTQREREMEARARLSGFAGDHWVCSASRIGDHAAAASLAGLVQDFLDSSLDEGCDDRDAAVADGGLDCDRGVSSGDDRGDEERDRAAGAVIGELMNPANDRDWFRLRLAANVSAAVEGLERYGGVAVAGVPAAVLRGAMVARLRAEGYNAGICKARWETSGGLTGGSYEYIDVVSAEAEEGERRRYIVDLDFSAEFAVARATVAYERVVAALPRLAVAREDAVRQVVRAVSDAARRSLRAQGLHVPPWRKSRYMLAKWMGPYRRTAGPAQAAAIAVLPAAGEVKSRAVGFRTTAIKICS